MKQTIFLSERIGASMTIHVFNELTEGLFYGDNTKKSQLMMKKHNAHTLFSSKDVKFKKNRKRQSRNFRYTKMYIYVLQLKVFRRRQFICYFNAIILYPPKNRLSFITKNIFVLSPFFSVYF